MKLNVEQDMKTQIMSVMFEGMFRKEKDSHYYTPMSKMAKTKDTNSMLHFSDYFLRFLPKTIHSTDIYRKYWPEHLECKVKSLVEDKALNEAIHEESYADLLHILNGKKEIKFNYILTNSPFLR